jgi:aminoglycoside phosphotransferase (APT) family kinase protein
VEGASALAFVPPAGTLEAAIEALASLHSLPIREGLRWEREPAGLLPEADVPLHRLGFASHEREPAERPLAEAHDALLAGPFGFVHGDATAAHILLAPGRATLINFTRAGYGPQLFDLAAFLLTAGIEPAGRRALAHRYANLRGMDARTTVDLTDLAGLIWSFETLLGLPRRLVENLGDDPASAALNTAAGRIDQGMRAPAGDHPAAAALRAALWPE